MDPSRTSSGCSGPRLDPNTCQTECQIECLKRCQIECQIDCQNRCQKECQSICQKECQTECQNIYLYIYIYAIYTSRWYVRNHVRIVCQGGDHSKKVFFFLEKYEEKQWTPTSNPTSDISQVPVVVRLNKSTLSTLWKFNSSLLKIPHL